MFISSVNAAYIDPALNRYLVGNTDAVDSRPIKVIVMMKNQIAAYNERAMIENNRQSMMTLAPVFSQFRATETVFKAEPLWIANAVILQIPANQLRTFAQHQNVAAIHANHMFWLELPRVSGSGDAQETTYGMKKLGIPELRAKFPELIGTGVTVGILDTGIDANHEELKGKVINWKDVISDKKAPYDDNGHGTHVAGTISGNSGIGAAPGVKLIIGKVFSSQGSASTDGILKAMQWIADPDGNPDTKDFPVLVSNSWGGGGPSKNKNPTDEAFCQAVDSWLKLGIAPIFANGNSGPGAQTVGLPAGCPGTIAVGATDANDAIASFSSRGNAVWKSVTLQKPMVSAPGVDVLSAKAGGGYVKFSGTSMATPHVSGAAALLYQVNPKMTVEQLASILVKGSKDLGKQGADPDFGEGRISVYDSVEFMKKNP